MRILIGVSDFGKIKRAEIDISNFTIFVGNNNSGKTYMMQLIYGLIGELPEFRLPVEDYELNINTEWEWGFEWIQNYEKRVNVYLAENKEKIVEKIFHKDIPINSLYLKIVDIDEKINIEFTERESEYVIDPSNHKNAYHIKGFPVRININKQKDGTGKVLESIIVLLKNKRDQEYIKHLIEKHTVEIMLDYRRKGQKQSLFLPASRTGMLLLYKYFFAERDEKLIEEIEQDSEIKYGNELGLSAPVYDFLQFLLRYTPNKMQTENNKDLINFIDSHLIDGTLQQEGDETIYIPAKTDRHVPLYLSSSMVNELTPMVKALTGAANYRYFFYDEIETCLHPEKQGEMARLLIRLINSGRKLIVSTHSDTMASKINNLLLLSFSDETDEEKKKKLDKLSLTENDLLKTKNVHVYQFANQSDGTSVVNELEFRRVPYIGYDFSQFMNTAQNLYDESVTIMG